MPARRRASSLLVAFLIAVAAVPARAADFNFGRLAQITLGLTAQGPVGAVCAVGFIDFGPTGSVLGGADTRCDDSSFPITGGGLTLLGDGSVAGSIGGDSIFGQLLPAGHGIVGVTSTNNSIPSGVGLTMFFEADNAGFTQDDLAGTWRVKSLTGQQAPGSLSETSFGSITLDAAGTVIGGTLQYSDGSSASLVDGRVAIESTGQIGGSILTDDGETFDGFSVVAFMAPDRNFIGGISLGEDGFANQSGMFFLQRAPTVTYAPSDLAGTWQIFALQANAGNSADGTHLRGTVTFDDSGQITAASLVNAAGQVFPPVVEGFFGLDAQGFIDGSATFVTGGVLQTRASMLQDKQQIIGINLFEPNDDVSASTLGLFSMFKPGAAPPPPAASTLRFSASTYTAAEGTAATITVRRGGATTTAVSVDFVAVNAATDSTLASGTLTFGPGQTTQTFPVPIPQNNAADGDRLVDLELSNPTNGATLVDPSRAVLTVKDDESLVEFARSEYSVTESGKTATIAVRRSGGLDFPAVVLFSATPGTAVAGRDFRPVAGELSFMPRETVKSFNVPILDNTTLDGDRTVVLGVAPAVPTDASAARAAAPTRAEIGERSTATLTITDNDQPGLIKLSSAAYGGSEGTVVVITIQRVRVGAAPLASNVSVSYATSSNGSAVAGLDYTAVSGTVTFTKTENTRTVSIRLLNDDLAEGKETFLFALGAPTQGAALGTPSQALVRIDDTDKGGVVVLSQKAYTVTEGGGNLSVTVKRSAGTAGNVSVVFTTADGTAISGVDYGSVSATVDFGFNETTKTVIVPILQDLDRDGDKTFTVLLSSPQGGATLGTPASAPVRIRDDESAIQFQQPVFEAREGTAGLIRVVRAGALVTPATVSFNVSAVTAVPNVDFTEVSGTLVFKPSQSVATFSVPTLRNARLDGDRSVRLDLGPPTGGAQLGPNATALLHIIDDEQPGVIRLGKASYSVTEGGVVVVDIVRGPAPGVRGPLGGNVSVDVVTANVDAVTGAATAGSDFTPIAATVVFGPNETKKTVTIATSEDDLAEGREVFRVALTNAAGGATLGSPFFAEVAIVDDDRGGVVVLAQQAYTVREDAGSVTIVVRRTGGSAGNASVEFATVGGAAVDGGEEGDYEGIATTLVFGPGETSKMVVIPIFNDDAGEGDQAFSVVLSNPQGGLKLGSPSTARVTIVDDETVIQFSGRFIKNQPEVLRTGSLEGNVSVQYVAESGTALLGEDFRLPPGTLVFPPGVRSRTIPIITLGDDIAEGPETFTITLLNPTGPALLGPRSSETFTLDDADFGGTVSFADARPTVSAGETATITIVRKGGAGIVMTVGWSAVGGTAVAGEDFFPTSGTVTFRGNQSAQTFSVNLGASAAGKTILFALTVPEGSGRIGAIDASTLTVLEPLDIERASVTGGIDADGTAAAGRR